MTRRHPELNKLVSTFLTGFAPHKMPCPEISLPKIDVSALDSPDTRAVELQKLLDCFSGVGFCLVSGVPGYSPEDLFEAVRWFYYDVSEQERYEQLATNAFNPKNKNYYRG